MSERGRGLKDLLWALAFVGGLAIALRLWYGLGATTNLSDALPWGLWKIVNMVAGVALGTGGFTVAFLVYVVGLERLRPLVRPAVLIAFLAYGSSCLALFLDIGLPFRIWHPILLWNFRSFLFEVAWCVMLYLTITVLELAPTLLGRLRLQRAAHLLHRLAYPIVTIGITLSALHHTSLGSLFLVTPERLHPLWYTPRLPVLFILSAAGAGMMLVVLAKLVYARCYDPASVFEVATAGGCADAELAGSEPAAAPPPRGPDFPMLRQLASIAAGVLGVYLLLKLLDLLLTGSWQALLAGTPESWLWTGELLLGAALPVSLLALPRLRNMPQVVGAAAASAVLGLIWNRLDVGLFGYFRTAESAYWPSLAEWALSLGIPAAAALVFFMAAEKLPIFDDCWRTRWERERSFLPCFQGFSRVWSAGLSDGVGRVSLIAVFVLPAAWLALRPTVPAARRPAAEPVQPPLAADAVRAVLLIDGNRSGMATAFPHADHQRRLGGPSSCDRCHHLCWPRDRATPCRRCHRWMERASPLFDHERHLVAVARRDRLTGLVPENHSCAACHAAGQPRGRASAKPCLECHRSDMRVGRQPKGAHAMLSASGYRSAMHETCLACHRLEAARQGRPALAECVTCHPTLGVPLLAVPPARLAAGARGLSASGARASSLRSTRPCW